MDNTSLKVILASSLLIANNWVSADTHLAREMGLGDPFGAAGLTNSKENELGSIPDISRHFKKESGGVKPQVIQRRLSVISDSPLSLTRGAKEAKLYSTLAPRVVMVVTNDSLGSGAIVEESGKILTNWHVVEGYEIVGVIYKPSIEGQQVSEANFRKARVVKFDEVADLALLRVDEPPQGQSTMVLGDMSEIPVGSDVHAIGHPTGESWTYTRGIVSQMRRDYEWTTKSGKLHIADVIQTQTPINPGNSGGPLISDDYNLVGVNSFKAEGEALNFAVSVDDVRRFLASKESRYARSAEDQTGDGENVGCEPTDLGNERTDQNDGLLTYLDFDCDGVADARVTTPDDTEQPETIEMDSTGDGKIDSVYADLDRDGNVDESYYDTNADAEVDLVGYHRNGDFEPYRWEEFEG